MSLSNFDPITLVLFIGGIADIVIAVIVALILFVLYIRNAQSGDTPNNVLGVAISLIIPVLAVIIGLIVRANLEHASFFTALYIALLGLFEIFMVINAIVLFNLFRRLVANKNTAVTILYAVLSIVGTLLGMTFIGIAWFLILI